ALLIPLFALIPGCNTTMDPVTGIGAEPGTAPGFAVVPSKTAWSAATPLTELNTSAATEGCPFITRSGQDLYFASNRAGGFGGLDIYVSHWATLANQWGTPVNLGAGVNTSANEQCSLPLQTTGELIFASDRPGGLGGLDLWMAEPLDRSSDLGWGSAVDLTALNSSGAEFGPGAYEDKGNTVIYFNSNRAGGSGAHDLYVSTRSKDGTFSAPVPAAGLNTAYDEQYAALSKNGLEIFFASNRPGTLGGLDLYTSTRASTSDAWGTPVNLGPNVNSSGVEGRSSISWDDMTLIFNSNRTGNVDLYQSTRTRTSSR
ncbi:MAG TPA: hypothetical protein VFC35_09145, partial [Gemmatimonadaceae bacterium]|nr:hypothetical protein [Gemmatimonadaceae bacterium]